MFFLNYIAINFSNTIGLFPTHNKRMHYSEGICKSYLPSYRNRKPSMLLELKKQQTLTTSGPCNVDILLDATRGNSQNSTKESIS